MLGLGMDCREREALRPDGYYSCSEMARKLYDAFANDDRPAEPVRDLRYSSFNEHLCKKYSDILIYMFDNNYRLDVLTNMDLLKAAQKKYKGSDEELQRYLDFIAVCKTMSNKNERDEYIRTHILEAAKLEGYVA